MKVSALVHRVGVTAAALLVVFPQVAAEHAVTFNVSDDAVQKIVAVCAIALTLGRTVFADDK